MTRQEAPTETCQWCEHWEQDTCVNAESDWWNHRRGAGCTCTEFQGREVRQKKLARA